MALTLVVLSERPEHAHQITLDSPRIVLGRASSCDLCLPDLSVSLRHASLRQRGQDYIILDEGSTNGTFVGPVRLAPQASRVIRSGDLLRLGRVWLSVRSESVPVTDNPALATREIALGMVAQALRADGQQTQPCVTVLEGPDAGATLEIAENERRYIAGRSSSADLVLTDAEASRRHVEVFRRGAQIFVRDLSSKNGTLLAGQRLVGDREVLWVVSAHLQIGLDKFALSDPVAVALAELSSSADEHLSPHQDIPIPGPGPVEASSGGHAATSAEAPKPRPSRRERAPHARKYAPVDVLIAVVAIAVLVASLVALYWLFSGASVTG